MFINFTSLIHIQNVFSSKEGYGPGLIQMCILLLAETLKSSVFFPTYSNQDSNPASTTNFFGGFHLVSLGLTKKQKPKNVRLPSSDDEPPRFETSNLVTFNAFNKQGSGAGGVWGGEDCQRPTRCTG